MLDPRRQPGFQLAVGLRGLLERRHARQEAASLARQQGALLFGQDSRTALAAYERAARHDPDDIWTLYFIGDLQRTLGDLPAAHQAYRQAAALAAKQSLEKPQDFEAQHDLALSHIKIGDVLVAQGDRSGALAAYRKGLAIREKLAARAPANTE